MGKDGEADVFILLERKDEMEALIQVQYSVPLPADPQQLSRLSWPLLA